LHQEVSLKATARPRGCARQPGGGFSAFALAGLKAAQAAASAPKADGLRAIARRKALLPRVDEVTLLDVQIVTGYGTAAGDDFWAKLKTSRK
jgi:hypothetical protein